MSTTVKIPCPSCQSGVAADSGFCPWCGVPLNSEVELPEADANAAAGASREGRSRRELREDRSWDPTTGSSRVVAAPRGAPLGPAFDGVTPARTARRLGSFAIDVSIVALVGGVVFLLTSSPVAASLTAAEIAVALVLWEARTGKTLGNAALGLRAAKVETPLAPGLGRAVGRATLLAASHLVPVVGPLVLVGSTAGDGSGRGRGWHDRASKTVVVDVRAMHREEAVAAEPAPVFQAPVVVNAPAEPAAPPSYVVTLDTGESMTVTGWGYVGRHPQAPEGEICDHVIEIEDDADRSLSRTHARFGVDDSGFWVEDRGSANGSSVIDADGSSVQAEPGQRIVVPSGGTVRLGDRTFAVQVLG